METFRLFIAIPLPDSLLKKLAALQNSLERRIPSRSVRWVRPGGIHLTLKFLGDTLVEKLPDIKQALAAVARHAPTCSFTVEGLGCFPNPRRPRVVWVGVQEPTGRLTALQDVKVDLPQEAAVRVYRAAFLQALTVVGLAFGLEPRGGATVEQVGRGQAAIPSWGEASLEG